MYSVMITYVVVFVLGFALAVFLVYIAFRVGRYTLSTGRRGSEDEFSRTSYAEALEDKKEVEGILRNIADGLIVADSKGRVVKMNSAASRMLGAGKKERVLPEEVSKGRIFAFSGDTSQQWKKKMELAAKGDVTKGILRSNTAVIEDKSGRIVGIMSVLGDLTKQRELDRVKATFVANVTHELRTPLVALGKSIALILQGSVGGLTEQQTQMLSIAERNLKRLTGLINDLLDLSKLEAGKMQIKPREVRVDDMVGDAVSGLRTWAETKNISLTEKIEGGLPEIRADHDRVIQVLNNLIGNAIKFTPPGGSIEVRASAWKVGGGVEVAVKDNGKGMSEEKIDKIFNKVYRADDHSDDEIGVGIGLAIAREIVELHGGEIWGKSAEGKGTEFMFTLPGKPPSRA